MGRGSDGVDRSCNAQKSIDFATYKFSRYEPLDGRNDGPAGTPSHRVAHQSTEKATGGLR